MNLEKRFLPSKTEGKVTGVVLAEISRIEAVIKNGYECADVILKVSNFEKKNQEIKVTLFKNSFTGVGIEEFITVMGENDSEKLKKKLFYASLIVNNKGYQEISNLFFKISESELIHDPRVEVPKATISDDYFDIFED